MFPSCKKEYSLFFFLYFVLCFLVCSDLKQKFVFVDSTLQLKVKKMEEERERSVQEGDGNTEKPDLKPDRLRNEDEPGKPGSVSGEESDREDRSVNESNSTASGGGEDAVAKLEEVEPVQGGSGEPDPVVSGSNRKALDEEGGGGGGESCEFGDSVTQLSSESLNSGRKRKGIERKEEVSVTGGEETVAVKSEPVVGFLEMIRAHRNGSLFESLLESQVCTVWAFLLIFSVFVFNK